MICCRCCGFDAYFDARRARAELRRYRRRGPAASTRLLVQLLEREDVRGASLLDIGGGIGAIQHALLAAGARCATDVDGSAAYLEAAREEAARRGHGDRSTFRAGDFVELAAEIDAADIVTLDRVICCYPDMPALLEAAAARARRVCGLVFPRRRWLVRAARPLINGLHRGRGCPLRLYLHPPDAVRGVAERSGFVPHAAARTLIWQVELYRRVREP